MYTNNYLIQIILYYNNKREYFIFKMTFNFTYIKVTINAIKTHYKL